MLRNLYLDGRRPGVILGRDGPAVRVERPEYAPSLLPIRWLGAVVVRGDVTMKGDAIIALLEQGVSLVFIGSDGRWLGRTHGTALQGLTASVGLLQDNDNGRQMIMDWRLSQMRRSMLQVADLLDPVAAERWRHRGMTTLAWQNWLRGRLATGVAMQQAERLTDYLGQLVEAMSAERLRRSELDPGLMVGPAQGLRPLAGLMAETLRPHVERKILELTAAQAERVFVRGPHGWGITSAGMRRWTVRFESERTLWSHRVSAMVESFIRHVSQNTR